MKKKWTRKTTKKDPNTPWNQMDEYDVYNLKMDQCQYCEYFSNITSKAIGMGTCDYIGRVGHSRGCTPLQCKTIGIFKRKKGNEDGKRKEKCLED